MQTTHKLKCCVVSGVLLSLASSQAYAEQLKNLEDSWYVGGAIGLSHLNPNTTGQYKVQSTADFSATAYAGVDISEHLGVEAFWSRLGESEVRGSDHDASVSYSAVGMNAIYHLKLDDIPIIPFVKAGIAKVSTKSKHPATFTQKNNFSLFTGVGAEYALDKQFRIRAGYDYFSKDISHLNIGLNWSPNDRDNNPLPDRKTAIIVPKKPKALPVAKKPKALPAALPNIVAVAKPRVPIAIIKKAVYRKPIVVKTPVYMTAPPRPDRIKVISSNLAGGSLFASNSSLLTALGRRKIMELNHEMISSKMKIYNIEITGHTDNLGSDIYNLNLSRRRSEAVANFLQSKGILRQVMTVIGYGEQRPLVSNNTAQGRARNRRVEIKVSGERTLVTRG
ncbi:MAG: OmpA family protein [Thiotrichaceae bacterium]|nr:OmpA family protein [Thiotrichaceae bacterium]